MRKISLEGVWLMLNQEEPKNYVLASGEMHSVRDFLEESLKVAGVEWYSKGEKENEKFYHSPSGHLIFEIDPKFYRPAEVHKLCGDSQLAEKELKWKMKTDFRGLVEKMYKNDYSLQGND